MFEYECTCSGKTESKVFSTYPFLQLLPANRKIIVCSGFTRLRAESMNSLNVREYQLNVPEVLGTKVIILSIYVAMLFNNGCESITS